MSASVRVLLVGNPEPTHVGGHFLAAARATNVEAECLDVAAAYRGAWWRRQVAWRLRGRRPLHLRQFARNVEDAAERMRPDVLLATGLAPIDQATLVRIRSRGTRTANFLTDDPWNPAHAAPWFLRALPAYDVVFSPRRANLEDLRRLAGGDVEYLPFAYSPEVHFPERATSAEDRSRLVADVVFAGGADADRVAAVAPLIEAGVSIALYGGYWDRHETTRVHARGFLDAAGLRQAIGEARIALCLVRRANRDGHAMRTFEVAAMGACMLVEDTAEHREFFGPDLESVKYFGSTRDMVESARWLLEEAGERARLAAAVRARIAAGHHTYADRLATILARLRPAAT